MLDSSTKTSTKEYEVLFSLYSPGADIEKALSQFRNACDTQYDVIGVHSTIIPLPSGNPQQNKKVLVRFLSEASTDEVFKKRLNEFVSIISASIDDVVWHTHVWRFETKGAPPFVDSCAEKVTVINNDGGC